MLAIAEPVHHHKMELLQMQGNGNTPLEEEILKDLDDKVPNPQDSPFYGGYFKLDYREFNAKDFYSRKAGKKQKKGEYLVGSSINKIDLINDGTGIIRATCDSCRAGSSKKV